MDGTALAYHTQLTDWYSHKQRQQGLRHQTKQCPLSPDKYQSIDQWCTEVSKLFVKPPKKEPPPLFRKCKYSDSMFPPNKSTVRGHSASSSTRLWSTPGKRTSVRSAVLTGKAGVKPGSADADRSVADPKNTALAAKMAESADHYVQERKVVHLNIQPVWKRKLSTGWTINRPLLYPKNPPPPPPESLLVDIPDYLVRNGEKRLEVSLASSASKSKPSTSSSLSLEIPNTVDLSEQTDDNENAKAIDNDEYVDSHSHANSKGTQCEPFDEVGEEDVDEKPQGEAEEETMSPRTRYKLIITDRSTSNDILNVLSVDDCKMMLRYRPARVIDTHDSMILPPSKSHNAHLDPDREDSGDVVSEDAASSTSTQNTPIRLSQGSARTTLSHTQVQSRVQAYKEMYDTYSRRTPEDKVQRPSSAAVEKAFEVLLDRKFQACQSSRRPLSSPPQVPASRNSSIHNHSFSSGSTPSVRFQQLNATLRQHMYDFVDSRWHGTKMKFEKSKSGYTRSAMKRGRMITSSPKLSWMPDEELVEDRVGH